jgi:hypothetical protein
VLHDRSRSSGHPTLSPSAFPIEMVWQLLTARAVTNAEAPETGRRDQAQEVGDEQRARSGPHKRR